MADRRLDVLFVTPNSSRQVYQDLSKDHAAVEIPVWSLLLAQSCRAAGFGVQILDCNAERLGNHFAARLIADINPRLVCFVVYGSEPNAGTKNMVGAVSLLDKLVVAAPYLKVCFAGTHTQALPREVLTRAGVNFVLQNEGVYALRALLRMDLENGPFDEVYGIGWKERDGTIRINPAGRIIPQYRMDEDMPGYAWDLLPSTDKYRCHFWHANFDQTKRTPAAALYTSLGCPMKCAFCCINLINRTDHLSGVTSADSAVFRFWSAEHTLAQISQLASVGIKNIRLSDEMFFLKRSHYEPLLFKIRERFGDSLNMWAYARVDTVKPGSLKLFRDAGIKWLCLGIETASQQVRREVDKGGNYETVDIRRVVKEVQDAGINVIANYIFGLPDDNFDTMQETLNLSAELNTEYWNAYPAMAIPGTPLYYQALANGWQLPESYSGYSFHSWDCQPLPTKHLTAAEVLKFRDNAFRYYFSRPAYLDMIENKFGKAARESIETQTAIRLKRRLLGDPRPD